MQGRRLSDNFADTPDFTWEKVENGDYFKSKGGWYVHSPTGDPGRIVEPNWTIIEHEDRTITVSPSIWFDTPHGWHGFLEKGVWRKA